jgi:hypothetical protein
MVEQEEDFIEIDRNGEEIKVKEKEKVMVDNKVLSSYYTPKPHNKMGETKHSFYGTYENDYSKLWKNERGWTYYAKKFCCCI